jgi:dCTP deaminase
MILSDREIFALVRRGHIDIEPPPPDPSDKNDKSRVWSSTALDLRLHHIVVRWKDKPSCPPTGAPFKYVDPAGDNFNVQLLAEDSDYATRFDITTQEFLLEPKQFILGYTIEKIRIPHECRIAARVEGKSSLARIGLGVHVTAPTIHSGFGVSDIDNSLPIQLEIFNLGVFPIKLTHKLRICQVIFEEVREVPTAGYAGQFSQQKTFSVPKKS